MTNEIEDMVDWREALGVELFGKGKRFDELANVLEDAKVDFDHMSSWIAENYGFQDWNVVKKLDPIQEAKKIFVTFEQKNAFCEWLEEFYNLDEIEHEDCSDGEGGLDRSYSCPLFKVYELLDIDDEMDDKMAKKVRDYADDVSDFMENEKVSWEYKTR